MFRTEVQAQFEKLLFMLMIVDLPFLGRHYFGIFRVEGKLSRVSSSPRFRREGRRSIPRAISKSASRMADGRADLGRSELARPLH